MALKEERIGRCPHCNRQVHVIGYQFIHFCVVKNRMLSHFIDGVECLVDLDPPLDNKPSKPPETIDINIF